MVDALRLALTDEIDVLGEVYERVVTGVSRRRLGTFFTPPSVVDFMVTHASTLVAPVERVVDPGAGVGAFSVSAAQCWPDAEVLGVDVNVVTLGLLAVRAHHSVGGGRLRLLHHDYLAWTADPANWQHAGPTLLLGNPPYTRHQELDGKFKALARTSCGDLLDSGLAGLAAYFVAASLQALRPEDGLCFVLPGSWVEARYGRPLRDWLWKASTRPIEIYAFPSATEVFPGTQVTVSLLTVGAERRRRARFHTSAATLAGRRLTVGDRTAHVRDGPMPDLGHALWPAWPSRPAGGTTALTEIARVRRGVATGANAFFFLTDAEAKDLPKRSYVAALRRLRQVVGDVLDQRAHDAIGLAHQPRWLLNLSDPDVVADDEIQYRIAQGVKAGYEARYLTSIRKDWYVTEMVDPPDIFLTIMGKTHLRAVWNKLGAVPSNSMYGVYLNDVSRAAELVTWLNGRDGQRALQHEARHYSDGLLKLESKACLRLRVPRSFVDAE